MARVVDVHVKSDPTSCRSLADWLKQLGANNRGAADAAFKTSSSSETIWHGEAGENFRSQQYRAGRDIDELVEGVDWLARGLERFADDIDTVRGGMRHCLEMARDAGLTVTGTAIHEPPGGVTNTAPGQVGGDMPALDPHHSEHMALEALNDAYSSVEASASDMRDLERTAHRSLAKCIEGGNGITDALLSNPQTWMARGLVATGTVQAAASGLAENAKAEYAFADMYQREAAEYNIPASVREARLKGMLRNAGMDDAAANSNARLLFGGPMTKAGTYVMNSLGANLGVGDGKSSLKRVGKLFNVAALGASLGFTVQDIANGKPIGKSIWTNFGGFAAGTAASSGFSAAATRGGFLSVAESPITVSSLGVGFLGTTAFNYFQDHDLRDLYRDLSDDGGNSANDQSDEYRKARYGH